MLLQVDWHLSNSYHNRHGMFPYGNFVTCLTINHRLLLIYWTLVKYRFTSLTSLTSLQILESPNKIQFYYVTLDRLDESLVSKRSNGERVVGLVDGKGLGLSGGAGLSSELDNLVLGLGLLSLEIVGLDSVKELLSALGVLDVLDSEVDSLLHESVANNLVDDDANSGLGHVVDDSSSAVVELVGHTLLDGTVGSDVNNVSNLVGLQVDGHGDSSVLLEVPREHVSGSASVSVTELV